MRTWRIVSGTLDGVLFIVMMVQSCAAGVLNALSTHSDNSGALGLLCAALILVAGVISLAFRSKLDEGHALLASLYGVAAVVGVFFHGIYSDLLFWGIWAAVCAVVTLVLPLLAKSRNTSVAVAMIFFVLSCLLLLAAIAAIVYVGVTDKFPASYLFASMGAVVVFGGAAYGFAGPAFE